jgi:predicted Fe-Mo cluster-binding NifX family protein
LKIIKIAIPTNERGGMSDTVSDVFGRAKTFTLIDMEGKEIKDIEIVENTAASYKHGAGPLAVKILVDMKVDKVVAGDVGTGVSSLLKEFNVEKIDVTPNTPVMNAIKKITHTM